MRLLLDTHALIWWFANDPSLSTAARKAISDGRSSVHVSAASAWEVATKYRIGKLPSAAALVSSLERFVAAEGFAPLAISMAHGERAGSLPGPHGDPFDRMLIAQAIMENMELVSNERAFDAYGVRRLW